MDRWVIVLILLVVGSAIMCDGTGTSRGAKTTNGPQDDSGVNVEPQQQPDDWRRTTNGWERASRWEQERLRNSPPQRTVHPALVGLFCVLASIGALVAFSGKTHASAEQARPLNDGS